VASLLIDKETMKLTVSLSPINPENFKLLSGLRIRFTLDRNGLRLEHGHDRYAYWTRYKSAKIVRDSRKGYDRNGLIRSTYPFCLMKPISQNVQKRQKWYGCPLLL